MTLPANFTARTLVMPTPCIVWMGALNAKGYGCFGLDGDTKLAHRVAYEFENGPIPDGLTIDHLCRVKRCVNPAHLEAVTGRENTRRAVEQDRPTECAQGHPYSAENTGIKPRRNGGQQMFCRTCQRSWSKTWRDSQREPATPDPAKCGTATNYRRGCRCDACREAKRNSRATA